jgi:hypothetical protein
MLPQQLMPGAYSLWIDVEGTSVANTPDMHDNDDDRSIYSSLMILTAPQILRTSASALGGGRPSGGDIVDVYLSATSNSISFSTVSKKFNVRCRFGTDVTVGTWIRNFTAVRCISPPNPSSTNVSVAVSVNGLHWTNTPVWFTYVNLPRLTHVTPNTGPSVGGTNVTLIGEHFGPNSSSLYCHFGRAKPVSAVRLSGNSVRCVAPSFADDDAAAAVEEELFNHHHTGWQVSVHISTNGNISTA